MVNFVIPLKLEELEESRPGQLCAADVPSAGSPEDVETAYHEGLEALAEGPLKVLEQDTFDAVFTVIRDLKLLKPNYALELAKSMCQHLVSLATSGLEELRNEERDKGDPVVTQHRSSIHVYVYFLYCTAEHFRQLQLQSQKAEASETGPKKGRGKKTKASADNDADDVAIAWPSVRERIARAFSRTLQADLDTVLYRSPADKLRLLDVCVKTCVRCLEDSTISCKTKEACIDVIALAATKHANCADCLDNTAREVFRLVKEGHDTGPAVAVDAAASANKTYGSASLAKKLLAKFCKKGPDAYDDLAKRDTKPVKLAAELLSRLAKLMPEAVHAFLPQLQLYFGCQSAMMIRKALVETFAQLVGYYKCRQIRETSSKPLQDSIDHATGVLLERTRDMAALVRKEALDTIADLVEHDTWPLELMVAAAKCAVARLDDSSLAAGAALDLLQMIASHWGPDELTDTRLIASIKQCEMQLQNTAPDVVEEREVEGPCWDAGALGGDTAEPAQPVVQPGASQPPIVPPTQLETGQGKSRMTHSQLKLLVALLTAHLELSRTLAAALPEVETLLTSDSAAVTKKAIQLLTLLSQKRLQGVQESWRRVWHLIFSTSEDVRNTVLEAFDTYLSPTDNPAKGGKAQQERNSAIVKKLVLMVDNIALIDLEALDELMRLAIRPGPNDVEPLLLPDVLQKLLRDLRKQIDLAVLLPRGSDQAREVCALAGRFSILCTVVVRHAPELAVQSMEHLVTCLKNSHIVLKDAFLVRNLAVMLGDLAPALNARPKGRAPSGPNTPAAQLPAALTNLISVLVSSHLPESGGAWEPAAKAAIAAIYRLHAEPHKLMEPLLRHLSTALVHGGGGGPCSAVQLSRTLFIVGCVATEQLALVDSLAKRVRRERAAREKAAAEARGGRGAAADDVDAQLGTGQAREHLLDALQDALEAELSREAGLLGAWGKLVSGICHEAALLADHPALAAAAMTTLAKLMALDASYCDANASVFFTRLIGCGNVKLASSVRCSMLVALGDLGRRHPNVMEPWTERMFTCLRDEDEEVSRTCLRVLAHMILSDMTKPKGHMTSVARCLVATSDAVRDLAVRLFNSLASKQSKGGKTTIDGYLAEIISEATRGEPMAEQDYKTMMKRLLDYIKAEKNVDTLKARLCERFENVVCEFQGAAAAAAAAAAASSAPAAPHSVPAFGTAGGPSSYESVVREWRGLAMCLELLPYSEKGLRSVMESFRRYKHALGDERVYEVFKGMAEHGRRGNRTAELKAEVAEYEARLDEAHALLREEQLQQAAAAAAAAAAARAAAAQPVPVAAPDGDHSNGQPQEPQEMADEQMEEEEEGEESSEEDAEEEEEPRVRAQGAQADQEAPGSQALGGDGGGKEGEGHGDEEAEQSGEEDGEDSSQSGSDDDDGDSDGSGPNDVDMDGMDWEESAKAAAATPRGRRAARHEAGDALASTLGGANHAGTPMAITPIPQGPGGGAGSEDMAWSPAPAAAAALQENVAPVPFGGFGIKPDPEGAAVAKMGPVVVSGRNVVGVRIKPDPEGRRA